MTMLYNYRDKLYANYNQTWGKFSDVKQVRAYLKAWERDFTLELLPLIPSRRDIRVLDLGSGYGPLIYAMKNSGYANLTGVDLSPDQVRVAHDLGQTEVQQGDAIEFLRRSPGQFDLITCIDMLEHYGKDEVVELLTLVKEALKPDGVALFRTPNVDAPFGTAFAFGDFTHECILNKFSALELFQSMGFAAVEVKPSVTRFSSPLRELLRKILWAIVTLVSRATMFATGIANSNVLLTRNIIIRASRDS